jgi:glycosyltransferase involved in cell wall biosynthesis
MGDQGGVVPGGPRALLVVENAPVPRDRRVWQEAESLRQAGWEVTVVAPRGPRSSHPAAERIDGIEVRRFPLARSLGGAAAWLREYAQAIWRIRRTVRKLADESPFDVIHLANPPDFLVLAVLRERRRGTGVVFDQHDLMPEMARERFGRLGLPFQAALLACERLAHRLADVSIVANDSFRQLALQRGGSAPEDVFVVRNGPRLDRFTPEPPEPGLRRGREHLIVYEGIMGRLDGVDHAVRALAALQRRRDDWHALFMGEGEALDSLRALAAELQLGDRVEFPGYVLDSAMRQAICTAAVCLVPDPCNRLTDRSTLMKVAEYMAMGRAMVAYPLTESKATAGASAAYARANDPEDFARVIDELLDDPDRRARMGAEGRSRVENGLGWEHAERALLEAYERALENAAVRSKP